MFGFLKRKKSGGGNDQMPADLIAFMEAHVTLNKESIYILRQTKAYKQLSVKEQYHDLPIIYQDLEDFLIQVDEIQYNRSQLRMLLKELSLWGICHWL